MEADADERATFLRFISPFRLSDDDEVELKGCVWTTRREHAILRLDDGRYALVRGGPTRILLVMRDGRAVLAVDGIEMGVVEIVVHVHPMPTGPSQSDFDVLDVLGQDQSLLIELNGGRTVFRRKPRPE